MKQGVKSSSVINLSRGSHLNNKLIQFNTVSTEKQSEDDKGGSFPADLHANFQFCTAMFKVKATIRCLPCQFSKRLSAAYKLGTVWGDGMNIPSL